MCTRQECDYLNLKRCEEEKYIIRERGGVGGGEARIFSFDNLLITARLKLLSAALTKDGGQRFFQLLLVCSDH